MPANFKFDSKLLNSHSNELDSVIRIVFVHWISEYYKCSFFIQDVCV